MNFFLSWKENKVKKKRGKKEKKGRGKGTGGKRDGEEQKGGKKRR